MKQTAMTMLIQVEDKTEIERLLALLTIGLCVAIGSLPRNASARRIR